jgi:hypothetical protein
LFIKASVAGIVVPQTQNGVIFHRGRERVEEFEIVFSHTGINKVIR